jgi:hypothetical protein
MNEAITPDGEQPDTVTTASTKNSSIEAPAQAIHDVEPSVELFAAPETEEQVDESSESETPAPSEPETSFKTGEEPATEDGEHEDATTPLDDAEQFQSHMEEKEKVHVVHSVEDALANGGADANNGETQDGQDGQDGQDEVSSADTVPHHGSEAEPVRDEVSSAEQGDPGPAEDVEEAGLSEQVNEAVAPGITGTPDSQQPGMSMFSFALFPRNLPLHRAESRMCQRSGAVDAASRITRLVDFLHLIGYLCLPAHHSPPILSSHHRISMSWPRAAMHARNLHNSRRA